MSAGRLARAVLLAAGSAASLPAAAHIMQTAYNLPVPFWMYAYGATGALLASFVVVGYFVKARAVDQAPRAGAALDGAAARLLGAPGLWVVLRTASVLLLLLTVVSGLFGTPIPTANFSITFFWIAFVLGITYLSALVGGWYDLVNPWRVVLEALARRWPALLRGRVRYPASWGYYPALVLYMAFIWLELFGRAAPRSLALALIGYLLIALAFSATFGLSAWLRYGDVFAVFLRVVGKIAPIVVEGTGSAPARARVRLRLPFAGLLEERPDHSSLVVFILFMLSSTAFDGVHETVPWVTLFWKNLYPFLATFGTGGTPRPYLVLVNVYYWWQWAMLFVSPFVYLFVYWMFVWLARVLTRSRRTTVELATEFAYALVPIAFVYHVTHYYTLLLAQGPSVVALASDPLGRGWNLLGTREMFREGIVLEAGTIWHTQVWLILGGHIVSVYLAHVDALRIFRSSRAAILSQLPMLLLMVALTTIGLWILSMPIAAGQVLMPPTSPG